MKYFIIIMSLAGLTGCYEDTDVVLHQPGVYKGKVDQHARTAQQRAVLLEQRFRQVQTDR